MNYDVFITKDDPTLTLKLPTNILQEITSRSLENGSSVELEISIRLARTLERDLEMIDEDDQFALAAFAMIQK